MQHPYVQRPATFIYSFRTSFWTSSYRRTSTAVDTLSQVRRMFSSQYSKNFSLYQEPKLYSCTSCDITSQDHAMTSSCKQQQCKGHFCTYTAQRIMVNSKMGPPQGIIHEKQGCINVTDDSKVKNKVHIKQLDSLSQNGRVDSAHSHKKRMRGFEFWVVRWCLYARRWVIWCQRTDQVNFWARPNFFKVSKTSIKNSHFQIPKISTAYGYGSC